VSEIIIADDASTDVTCGIVQRLGSQDRRIHPRYIEKNRGAQAARNVGIVAARAEWIAFPGSDDYLLPRSIKSRLRPANSTGAEVVYSDALVIRQEDDAGMNFGVPPLGGDVYGALLKSPGPMFQGMLVKKT
jgi:teichuronic acid biosynthesis glycosyltransferase TuaG